MALLAIFRRSKSKPVAMPEALDLALMPWLMATAAVTLLPHFSALPIWLPIGATLTIAWRAWLWRRNALAGNKWLVLALALAGTVGIVVEYKTIFGRDPGVALLVLLMSLKLMELRAARDAVVVVMLGYFLLLTHYFYADSIPVGLWMLLAMIVGTATLIRLQAPHAGTPYDTIKNAGVLILQALPIMAVLFLLFPRITGPLWGLPQDTRKASSGLSEEMSPGSISDLSLSTALAFRAEFKGPMPARDLLYWRGPVMTDYDGKTWRINRTGNTPAPSVTAWPPNRTNAARFDSGTENLAEYALTLEPHQQRWLLALDMPVKLPSDAFLTSSLSAIGRNRVRDRLRMEFASLTNYRAGVEESTSILDRALLLPPGINPRSRELAASWRGKSNTSSVIVAKALQHYQQESFVYTLKAPLLGKDGIDEFLFESKRGFCEHYASSFVFLMRAAGIPARVVAGYLGGEQNPIDGHLAVRQSDAHAWAEVWIRGEGWRRIDPTASVAPNRIEQGLQASLPEGEVLPATLRPELDWLRAIRYRWDAVDYAWSRWILGYDNEQQRQLLSGFGMGNDWKTLIAILASAMGMLLLVLGIWVTRHKPRLDRAHALWVIACDGFAKRGVRRAPHEGPADYARRIAREKPVLGDLAMNIANNYIRVRYATTNSSSPKRHSDLSALYQQVGRIAPHWKLWRHRLCTTTKN